MRLLRPSTLPLAPVASMPMNFVICTSTEVLEPKQHRSRRAWWAEFRMHDDDVSPAFSRPIKTHSHVSCRSGMSVAHLENVRDTRWVYQLVLQARIHIKTDDYLRMHWLTPIAQHS